MREWQEIMKKQKKRRGNKGESRELDLLNFRGEYAVEVGQHRLSDSDCTVCLSVAC